jgi:RHS repeat-associated protein
VPGKERYRYDGLGRRAQTLKPSGETTLWQYSHSGQMLFSSTWQGDFQHQTTHEHIYLAGSIVAIVDHRWPSNETIATKYQHTDALGSPMAVTNEQGQVVERNDYEPYGAIIGKPNRSGIGYTGHVMDGATGLTYMQQRYYDQSIGRFLSVDPVTAYNGDLRHFNRYAYAYNNPYMYTDPDGRSGLALVPPIIVACGLNSWYRNTAKAAAVTAIAYFGSRTLTEVRDLPQMNQEASEQPTESEPAGEKNTNPYAGPVEEPVVVVDEDGNAIPVEEGEQVKSSPDGKYQQVLGRDGKPTGTRLDKGGHRNQRDPKAQGPHGHRPGVTDETGNPHLPINPPKHPDPKVNP